MVVGNEGLGHTSAAGGVGKLGKGGEEAIVCGNRWSWWRWEFLASNLRKRRKGILINQRKKNKKEGVD